eukprot:3432341-Rhodomonas_salina.1
MRGSANTIDPTVSIRHDAANACDEKRGGVPPDRWLRKSACGSGLRPIGCLGPSGESGECTGASSQFSRPERKIRCVSTRHGEAGAWAEETNRVGLLGYLELYKLLHAHH